MITKTLDIKTIENILIASLQGSFTRQRINEVYLGDTSSVWKRVAWHATLKIVI